MIAGIVVFLLASAAPLADTQLTEARRALAAGRIEQARLMTDAASAQGMTGAVVDRLRADLYEAAGDHAQAVRLYEALLATSPGDSALAEQAGLAALRMGEVDRADRLLTLAIARPGASWKAWNGLGAIADSKGDWAAADRAYDHATQTVPNEPALLNNRGWSQLLRGDWQTAATLLEAAAKGAPADRRIADNLQLARAGLADQLPARQAGESDAQWAARLNDAGMAALARRDRARAVAAFARAIAARNAWYARAANNLTITQASP